MAYENAKEDLLHASVQKGPEAVFIIKRYMNRHNK